MSDHYYNSGEVANIGDEVERSSVGQDSVGTQTNAETGARAKVVEFQNFHGDPYLSIKWDRTDPRCHGQCDGGYNATSFNLIRRANEQTGVKQTQPKPSVSCGCPLALLMSQGCRCGGC